MPGDELEEARSVLRRVDVEPDLVALERRVRAATRAARPRQPAAGRGGARGWLAPVAAVLAVASVVLGVPTLPALLEREDAAPPPAVAGREGREVLEAAADAVRTTPLVARTTARVGGVRTVATAQAVPRRVVVENPGVVYRRVEVDGTALHTAVLRLRQLRWDGKTPLGADDTASQRQTDLLADAVGLERLDAVGALLSWADRPGAHVETSPVDGGDLRLDVRDGRGAGAVFVVDGDTDLPTAWAAWPGTEPTAAPARETGTPDPVPVAWLPRSRAVDDVLTMAAADRFGRVSFGRLFTLADADAGWPGLTPGSD